MADVRERPQLFGRKRSLLGIVAEPAQRVSIEPAVIILNAGIIHRVGPSRIGVALARFLAARGYRVLRFDLSGIGDSPRDPADRSLETAVLQDVTDAIELMTQPTDHTDGVVLFGICSGADNAFYIGAEDDRVRGMVLVDPTIHPTAGFRVRKLLARLLSARSWWNVLSGRSLLLRARRVLERHPRRPPGYYGLLTVDPQQAAARARAMSSRGAEFLYILTGGVGAYCNYPGQVADALSGAIPAQQLQVEWRPQADHVLTRDEDRAWLCDRTAAWLAGLAPAGAGRDPDAVSRQPGRLSASPAD
jgi:pimeloyl-ACP methyl ester carboxylesterase